MAIQIMQQQNGYSKHTYDSIFSEATIVALGKLRNIPKYLDNKPTGEIANKKMDVYFIGIGTQEIKFAFDYELPKNYKDLSEIELINPTALIFKNKLYVKADGIRMV
ncbi:hypothetical protein ACIJEF_001593 [Enterococcus faecalis]